MQLKKNQVLHKDHFRACIAGVSICCVLFVIFALSIPSVSMSQTKISIDNKINPNTAPAGSLVRLPNIGPARAKAIIAYRSGFGKNESAFKTYNDLENIKGIGPKTVERLAGLLYFE